MSSRSADTQWVHRAYCYRCMRAQLTCLCGGVQPFANRIPVHVVQHPRERKHAFGTVRILQLTLQDLRVSVLKPAATTGFVSPDHFPENAAILYPGPGAQTLDALAETDRPSRLVLIDGTWSQAHRIYRDCPWLHDLPRISIQPTTPGQYRIRKEPRQECLSTLESVVTALTALESDHTGLEVVLATFERMVLRQLDFIDANPSERSRKKTKRPRASRALPDWLAHDSQRIVIAYGELSPCERHDKQERELAQWSAVRLSEPETSFDALIAPQRPRPDHPFHPSIGWGDVPSTRLEALADVQKRWRAFVRPSDRIVSWNSSTLRFGRQFGLIDDGVLAKKLYADTHKGPIGSILGSILDVASRLGAEPVGTVGVAGRAGLRLAATRFVVAYLAQMSENVHRSEGSEWSGE